MLEYSKFPGDYNKLKWLEYGNIVNYQPWMRFARGSAALQHLFTIPNNSIDLDAKFLYNYYATWSTAIRKEFESRGTIYPFREIDKKSPNYINMCKILNCQDGRVIEYIRISNYEESDEYFPRIYYLLYTENLTVLYDVDKYFTDKDKNIYVFDVEDHVLKRNTIVY